MENPFKGKLAIITGGSSGVGKELARRLLNQGANLAIIARDQGKLQMLKEELKANASSQQIIQSYSCDVSNAKSVDKTFNKIDSYSGQAHILINSAGILREGYFEKQSLNIFREVMDINFFGTLHCIMSILPYFKKSGGGRIVNISSVAGLMGVFGYTAYSSSKHAVTGLTNSLRIELKPQNIKLHIVYPPEFDSPMVAEINKGRTYENRVMAQTIPVMDAASVADAIIAGIEREQYEIVPGFSTRIITRMERIFPSVGRMVVDSRIKKCYNGPE